MRHRLAPRALGGGNSDRGRSRCPGCRVPTYPEDHHVLVSQARIQLSERVHRDVPRRPLRLDPVAVDVPANGRRAEDHLLRLTQFPKRRLEYRSAVPFFVATVKPLAETSTGRQVHDNNSAHQLS